MVGMTLVSCLERWDELGSAATLTLLGKGLRVRGLEAANPGGNRS